jgi:hypothetical protein
VRDVAMATHSKLALNLIGDRRQILGPVESPKSADRLDVMVSLHETSAVFDDAVDSSS